MTRSPGAPAVGTPSVHVTAFSEPAAGLAITLLVACSGEDRPLADQWQARLDATLASDSSPPGLSLADRYGSTRFNGVARDDALEGEPLAEDSLFRVASVTKPFTWAAVLVHVERGDLVLKTPTA